MGIDTSVSNLFDGRGTSKAKRLRSFIERAPAGVVAKALRELWEYRESLSWPGVGIRDSYFAVVAIFEGASDHIDASAFEAFEPSQTLDELIAAIRRDLDAKKPQAALDRLHTYCMKRVRFTRAQAWWWRVRGTMRCTPELVDTLNCLLRSAT